MSSTLGEKLRQAREERGISISEVSEQTRISSQYLESIEDDNYKPLPGGIFNKGFVKSYAKYVGVDENEALQDYAKIVAATEGSEDEKLKAYRPEVLTDDRSGSSIIPTVIFAVIILGLMTAGILFLVNYIQNRESTPSVATNTSNSAANANNAVNTSVAPAAPAPAMETVKIEFKTSGEDISLTAVTDGKRSSENITAAKPVIFEPKQSLKLSYSKSKFQVAQMTINGKAITLPANPEVPRRNSIEFEINKENLAQIWQNGAVTFGTEATVPAADVTPTPAVAATPAPVAVRPTPKPTPARTPAPATTPIVVGNTARSTPKPN